MLHDGPENWSIQLFLSGIVWHTCVLILNRPFLLENLGIGFATGQVKKISGEPQAFVKERINLCLASARTITLLCKMMLSSIPFLTVSIASIIDVDVADVLLVSFDWIQLLPKRNGSPTGLDETTSHAVSD